ncbi:MAG: hypothetical protein RMJ87_03685 [Cytophagales bacterium]|nr:hypothetical protein [Bernardetiaceae bacterium]MDW8204108.1 hypothetical protein [Cytophagales bacterium]
MKSLLANPDGSINWEKIRHDYPKVADNQLNATAMMHQMEALEHRNNPLWIAYYGALQTLQARSIFNPLEKLQLTKRSQETLARAVALDPENPEIRFLRFSIQLGLPTYLNLSHHLAEDRRIICEKLPLAAQNKALPLHHIHKIASFMLREGKLEPTQKVVMENLLTQL